MEVPEIFPKDSSNLKLWELPQPVKSESIYFETLPSYGDFFNQIFRKNQLCFLGSSCTSKWASRKLWVDDLGAPDLEFLNHHFGTAKAPVANCNAEEFSSHPKMDMVVSDFVNYWQKYQEAGHSLQDQCLYLKDWHFKRDFPSFNAYSPPALLCSDWLNEFFDVRQDDAKQDDYRFVYMGPKNTWTPFHSDVLRSYSWSANICGRKKWIFFPPGEEENLKDQYGQLVYDLRDPSIKDSEKFPGAATVLEKAIVVIQNPGEIVFVPSGWHHQVFNLEDTISINHNWINGASAHLTWNFLKSRLSTVKAEIADCSEMDGFDIQCQKILKADSGMDYVDFYNFMATIARHRMFALEVFCHHKTEQEKKKSSLNTDVCVSLCLWTAALCNSPTLRAKTGDGDGVGEKPDLNDILVTTNINNGTESFSESSVQLDIDRADPASSPECPKTMKGEVSRHLHCPHWSHCGPHLAVFDLQRTRVILQEVVGQPEWEMVSSETEEVERSLVEETGALLDKVEETIARVFKCLSL